MRQDPKTANLPEREVAMLLLAIKAIRLSHSINEDDLNALRAMDWEDKDIFDAVNHAARMLASDIMLNTFKVEND